ncbi:MAG: sce7726 family protein [Acidobacteriota bacterium]
MKSFDAKAGVYFPINRSQVASDPQIRQLLLQSLRSTHDWNDDTLIIEELGLCQGEVRLDVAVISGAIHGYEIKSDGDTLRRLPAQREIYNRVLDFVTVIAGKRHLSKVQKLIPDWWGLCQVQATDNLKLEDIRPGKQNSAVDPSTLVQLLWKDEVLGVLKELGLDRGASSKSRTVLWERLVRNIRVEELKIIVRTKLKQRVHWRSAPQRGSDGGKYPR